MKKSILLVGAVIGLAVLVVGSRMGAQEKGPAKPAQWEYAMVKWDGPDRVQFILPSKFELVRMNDLGFKLPKDGQEEEFYLTMAANRLAKDGWEAVNLNSRRILMRRSL